MIYLKQTITAVFVLFFSITSSANIIGSDLENFNPTTDGLGYVTVESGEFLEPGRFNLGLFLDYGINVLPTINTNTISPNDKLLTSNFHLAIGILKWWSAGLSVTTLHQGDVDANSSASVLLETGREAFRFDSKIRLMDLEASRLALLIAINFNNINNNPYLGQDPGPAIAAGFAYEQILSETLRWALNLGYRTRNSGNALTGFSILPIEDQVFYSLGLNYNIVNWGTYLIAELYGSTPTDEPTNNTNREMSNLEALLGAKWELNKNLDAHIGVTRGIYSGLSTPDIRIYAGINWYFGPLWGESAYEEVDTRSGEYIDSDGDGVRDEIDECPNSTTTRVDSKGCLLQMSDRGSMDDDFDGVENQYDDCPNTPADVIVDDKGCTKVPTYADVDIEVPDSDGDGVNDDYDLCPDTPPGTKVTSRGCEAKRISEVDLGNLNFITGTDKLTKASRKRFMKKINHIYDMKNQIKKIVIEGHTDSVGSAKMNLRLSRLRSKTIRRILIKQTKIDPNKVTAKGYGESRPIATNKTKKGRLLNRRVEMNLIKF